MRNNKAYYPGKHRALILKILIDYGYEETNLVFVDNIGEWALQNGIKSILRDLERLGGFMEIALTLCINKSNKKLRLFVFSNVAPPSSVRQILNNPVLTNQYLSDYLETERQFIAHRVLHEVAHAKKGYTEQEEQKCDEWALKEMKFV